MLVHHRATHSIWFASTHLYTQRETLWSIYFPSSFYLFKDNLLKQSPFVLFCSICQTSSTWTWDITRWNVSLCHQRKAEQQSSTTQQHLSSRITTCRICRVCCIKSLHVNECQNVMQSSFPCAKFFFWLSVNRSPGIFQVTIPWCVF